MEILGKCGDNCSFCPRYIATKSGSTQELAKVKELWIRLGLRESGFPIQDMACHGCKPENKCAYKELRNCVFSKGLDHCGSCDEYPCELINGAFSESDELMFHAKKVCSKAEMDILYRAFFAKKEYLNSIHQKYLKKQ